MNWNSTSLEDVYHLALPVGTELVTPDANLKVSVLWACCSRPSPPVFPSLEGSELALLSMEDLKVFDASGGLSHVISRLQEAHIAGIAVQGLIDTHACETAIAVNMPLFQIPPQAQLLQVERDIIRLIVDRSAYMLQRAANLQRELNQITLDGGGLKVVADQIHHVTNQPFIVLDAVGHVVTASGLAPERIENTHLPAMLPNIMQLRSWAVRIPPEALPHHVEVLDLIPRAPLRDYHQAAMSAVTVADGIQGYCLLLRRISDPAGLSPIEEMAVTQGAAAVALDWVTRNAVGAAEERMRASFLDELLGSNIADEQAWIRRGRSLGYDMETPHAAWMIEAAHVPDWPRPMFQVLKESDMNPLSSFRDQGLLLYCPAATNPDTQVRQSKQEALELVERMRERHPQATIHIGIGSARSSLPEWLQSQQQAWESLRVNKKWGSSSVTHFEDLGLYQFLSSLRTLPETEHFVQTTLVDLQEYDTAHHAELLDTLSAYFVCHGNISQTAALLQVHRNTLTYRLRRITEIMYIDLEDPDVRFGLQLALKLLNLYK